MTAKTVTAPPPSDELTAEEAMQYLEISRSTFYKLVREGELTPIRKKIGRGIGGRRVFFKREDVEELKDAEA